MKVSIELSVPGMTGAGVCRDIELSLGGVDGVDYAHVNLGAAKVTWNSTIQKPPRSS